jgi:hypothetical protein
LVRFVIFFFFSAAGEVLGVGVFERAGGARSGCIVFSSVEIMHAGSEGGCVSGFLLSERFANRAGTKGAESSEEYK